MNTQNTATLYAGSDPSDVQSYQAISKYCFVFVCQAGEIEIGSLLLACSLIENSQCEYELQAIIPLPHEIFGTPKEETVSVLKALGVKVNRVENTILLNRISFLKERGNKQPHIGRYHMITNKHFALTVETDADKIVFIDSDLIVCKSLKPDERFAIPLNLLTVGDNGAGAFQGHYKKIFDACGVTMPNQIMRIQGQNRISYTPPHFSSAFFAVNKSIAQELFDRWTFFFHKVDASGILPKRAHTGQIALTLAIHDSGFPHEMVPRTGNFFSFMPGLNRSDLKTRQDLYKYLKSLIIKYPNVQGVMNSDDRWKAFHSTKKRWFI